MTTTSIERRKPSPRRRGAPAPGAPIIVEGRIVGAIDVGPPASTPSRVALTFGCVALAEAPIYLALDYLGHTNARTTSIALAVAAVALTAAAIAWIVDHNRRHPGGTR